METGIPSELQIIIPAAGASARLGRPKQNIPINGTPLWQHTLQLCTNLPAMVTMVSGNWRPEAELPERVKECHFTDWEDGLGASIAFGISQVDIPSKGYLILLCDQWRLTPKALHRFVRHWDGQHIQVAQDGRYSGPPVLFPVEFRAQLMALFGDRGAKELIDLNNPMHVPLMDARWDLDTPEDLQRLSIFATTDQQKENLYDYP